MDSKKQFIIQKYIESQNIDPYKLAEDSYIHPNYVKRVIREFRELSSVIYPIFCENSLSEVGVYYLFVEGAEKKIQTKNNRVINKVDLTDYEKFWLQLNKRIYAN